MSNSVTILGPGEDEPPPPIFESIDKIATSQVDGSSSTSSTAASSPLVLQEEKETGEESPSQRLDGTGSASPQLAALLEDRTRISIEFSENAAPQAGKVRPAEDRECSDSFLFVGSNQSVGSQRLPILVKLGADCAVSLSEWTPMGEGMGAQGWNNCFALVGAQGQLCVVGVPGFSPMYHGLQGASGLVTPASDLGFRLASLAVSREALFARSEDGRVYRFSAGEGAVSDTPFRTAPVQVDFKEAKSEVVQIAAGARHQLALTKTGQVFAWGRNNKGQLGVRCTNTAVSEPVLVSGLEEYSIASVACGLGHCAALTTDGKLLTWGWNTHGQLGHGHTRDCSAPLLVESLQNEVIVQVALGGSHTIARSQNCVWACGSNEVGQLGIVPCEADPETKAPAVPAVLRSCSTFLPVLCLDAPRVVNIGCGTYHSCALLGRHRPQVLLWGMGLPGYKMRTDLNLDGGRCAGLVVGAMHTAIISPEKPPLLPPRLSPVLQQLLDDAADPSKDINTIHVTLAPLNSSPVDMRLPVELLSLRAPVLLSSLLPPTFPPSARPAASSPGGPPLLPPLLACGRRGAFLSFLHYLAWGTCPLTDLDVVSDLLDLALRYELPVLATACQEFREATISAREAVNMGHELKSTRPEVKAEADPHAISFGALLASKKLKDAAAKQTNTQSAKKPAPVKVGVSVADALAPLAEGWSRPQVEASLAQFERDVWRGAQASSSSLQPMLLRAWHMEEKELKLVEELTPRCLETVKRFVYTGEFRPPQGLSVTEHGALLAQASAWQLPDLRDHLLAEIHRALATGSLSALSLLELSESFHEEALGYVALNTLNVDYDKLTHAVRTSLTDKQRRRIQPRSHVPAGCSMM